jgi:hypothetical protein
MAQGDANQPGKWRNDDKEFSERLHDFKVASPAAARADLS